MKKLLLIALLLVAGCAGTPFTWTDARKIKAGMTIDEVTAIMGPPYRVVSTSSGLRYTWSYADTFTGSKAVAIDIRDGRVVAPPPIPASF